MITDRAVGTLENNEFILNPRIEFWADTERAFGTLGITNSNFPITFRVVGTLENNDFIRKPRIEFWAVTGRAFGTVLLKTIPWIESALKARVVTAPNSIWG